MAENYAKEKSKATWDQLIFKEFNRNYLIYVTAIHGILFTQFYNDYLYKSCLTMAT